MALPLWCDAARDRQAFILGLIHEMCIDLRHWWVHADARYKAVAKRC